MGMGMGMNGTQSMNGRRQSNRMSLASVVSELIALPSTECLQTGVSSVMSLVVVVCHGLQTTRLGEVHQQKTKRLGWCCC
jgi:hypothetical protein